MDPKVAILFLLCFILISLDAIPLDVYQRNIPVEVRYEGQLVKVIPREVQARRNLDAKVQLNPRELNESLKYLPLQLEPQVLKGTLSEEKKQPSIDIEIQDSKPFLLPEAQENEANLQGKTVINSAQTKTSTLDKVLQESHLIIKNGLKNLRDSFQPGKGEFSPTLEQWASLEKAVENYFDEEKQKLLIRQSQQGGTDPAVPESPAAPAQNQNNWIQNIVNGFSGIANNFVQSIQSLGGSNNGNPPQGQEDEGAAGQPPNNQGFQGFIQFFNNGISNIVSTITGSNNIGPTTSNTNLSDLGTAQAPSGPIGFFGSIVTNVQNALGIQQSGQQSATGTQGDTGTSVQQQNGPIQVIQSVGNAITSFFQGPNQNRPPNTSGDEGSAPVQPSNTNIIQNIQNAIQNSPLNPFRPQGGTNNPNPIQNAIQSVGTQAQQIIPASNPSSSPDSAKKPVVEANSEENPQLQAQPDTEIIKKKIKTTAFTVA